MVTPPDKQNAVRIKRLESSKTAFSQLEKNVLGADTIKVPRGYQTHFFSASYAVNVLESLGEERLLSLEQEQIVHPSTISGSSLSSAKNCIEAYFGGEREFTKDHYEQLNRTCNSAQQIIQQR